MTSKNIQFDATTIETIIANYADKTIVIRVKGQMVIVAVVTGYNKMNGSLRPVLETLATYHTK
jgi:hypothetical protein